MRKKLLAMLLALMMVFSIVPLAASAEESSEDGCSGSPDGLHYWIEAGDAYHDAVAYDETTHYGLICLYCGEHGLVSNHIFETAEDGTTYCSMCLYGCDHAESDLVYGVLAADMHLTGCSVCGRTMGYSPHEYVNGVCACGMKECAHENCTYTYSEYESGHRIYCEDCQLGFVYAEDHTYDENGVCIFCGYDSATACSHVDEDGNGSCDICGKTYHLDADGDCVCDLCQQECHGDTTYATTKYGHYVVCSKCGTPIGTNLVGGYDGSPHSDSDGDGKCDTCGYIMDADAGEVSAATGGNVASAISMNTDAILSSADKNLIDQGYDVQITLSVNEITSTVSSTDSALILSAAGNNVIGVSYLDIDLTKIISDPYGAIQDETALTDLDTTVTVTVAIPQTLLDAVGTTSGNYSVVRIHDGVATVLATSYDSTAQTVTFTTDRFSTYGIVFTGSTSTNNTNTGLDDVPQTGDGSLILVGIALMMAAAPVVKKFVF